MKILLTGARGFVGMETEKVLLAAGHDVVPYDVMLGLDIRDAEQMERVMKHNVIDSVLHLAAVARFSDADRDPLLAFETNVQGTKNVVDVCKRLHIPLVYASTGSVYMPIKQEGAITEEFEAKGNSVYGCTKYVGELYVKQHTPHIILRYAHLYGKEKRGHGLVGGFVERIKRGLAPTLYGGQQSNDFTYIKDVARANRLAVEASWDKWNNVYNIGTGEELSARDAGKAICDATGWTGEVEVKEQRTVDADRFEFNCSKAKNMLGFEAEYNFQQGLTDMRMEGGFRDFPSVGYVITSEQETLHE